MIDYTAMGNRVRRFRKERGWTQAELADRVGISNITVSHIECGTNKPETNTIVDLANELGVTADDLLCDSLNAAVIPYHKELAEITKSCSTIELRLLCSIIKPILEVVRASSNNNLDGDDV